MVHIPFDTRTVSYDDHIIQIGGGIGIDENVLKEPYQYFRGSNPYQRGYGRQTGAGVGDILKGLFRFLLPVIKRAGTTVGKEALSTGERILDKISAGENIKDAVMTEGKKGVDTLLEKTGLPKQFGTGGIKRRRKPSPTPFHQTIVGRKVIKQPKQTKIKRKRIDTFGLY